MERARTGKLGKVQRLRTAGEFERVRQHGRSYATTRVVVRVVRQDPQGPLGPAETPESAQLLAPPRVGFAVGRRVGNAVVRNRVRRRLREQMRQRLGRLASGWDVLVSARAPAADASYDVLGHDLDDLLARAKVLAPGSEARPV